MRARRLTARDITAYTNHLRMEERAAATVEKYRRDIGAFAAWLEGRPVDRELVVQWRSCLLAEGRAPATVNAKLSAVNGLFCFLGWDECRVKFLRIQRQMFREKTRELTRREYERLVETARAQGRDRLELLMETICSTGIRVSEVRHITVEAAQTGQAVVHLKGKIRTILLSRKLCVKLLKYAKKVKTISGEIFRTKSGKGLSRKQIWQEMKSLCTQAGVEPSKVFPHNLRHLFATVFYQVSRDLVRLADTLGHSSVETTRIYLLTSVSEHMKYMERLRLVS
ncbi:integrase [Pseudoflavonifractor sp. 524-17]|uniref:tyrosine-type recombinase/integrase n=1 Tax=Pseudoflavonifractor sp. 524-17 TaxID=2304577 RepID=UPI00137B2463|nr:tyrosine-type recombinase/integrase [Pseudoflavonifractor sp. 524-17]NCE66174.1 integrase [Pseudoflavonifractor sp. 524-17]